MYWCEQRFLPEPSQWTENPIRRMLGWPSFSFFATMHIDKFVIVCVLVFRAVQKRMVSWILIVAKGSFGYYAKRMDNVMKGKCTWNQRREDDHPTLCYEAVTNHGGIDEGELVRVTWVLFTALTRSLLVWSLYCIS